MQEWFGSGTDQPADRQGHCHGAKPVVLIPWVRRLTSQRGLVASPLHGNDQQARRVNTAANRCLAFGLAFRCKLDACLAFVEMNEAIDVRVGTLFVEGGLENLTHEIADGHR